MNKLNSDKLNTGALNGKSLVEIRLGAKILWEAGNFRTADNFILVTKDNLIFNVKDPEIKNS